MSSCKGNFCQNPVQYKTKRPVNKIVTSGRVGAESAALHWAAETKINAFAYSLRSRRGLVESDATVIFTLGEMSRELRQAERFAKQRLRPVIRLHGAGDHLVEDHVLRLRRFLRNSGATTIHVLGEQLQVAGEHVMDVLEECYNG